MVGVYKAKRPLGHKAQTQILTPDQPSIITSSVSVTLHASMTTHTYTKSHCSYTSNGVLVCKPFVASTVMCKAQVVKGQMEISGLLCPEVNVQWAIYLWMNWKRDEKMPGLVLLSPVHTLAVILSLEVAKSLLVTSLFL